MSESDFQQISQISNYSQVKYGNRSQSVDSNALSRYKVEKCMMKQNSPRSQSVEYPSSSLSFYVNSEIMNPLPFEEVDLKSTPLSALRSCSEFQRRMRSLSNKSQKKINFKPVKAKSNSVTFSYFLIPLLSRKKQKGVKLTDVDDLDQRNYLIESLSRRDRNDGNQASEGQEDENRKRVFSDNSYHSCTDDRAIRRSQSSEFARYDFFSVNERAPIKQSARPRPNKQKLQNNDHTRSASITGAVTSALDFLFGDGPALHIENFIRSKTKENMEIELKEISKPTSISSSSSAKVLNEVNQGRGLHRRFMLSRSSSNLSLFHRNLSQLPSDVLVEVANTPSLSQSDRNTIAHENLSEARPLANVPFPDERVFPVAHHILQLTHRIDLRMFIRRVLQVAQSMALLCPWTMSLTVDDGWSMDVNASAHGIDDVLYEYLRVQPFTAGYFLRAMLWAGYGGCVFNAWTLMTWPSEAILVMESAHQFVALYIQLYLMGQLLLDLMLLTPRFIIHIQCWSCTHFLDIDAALEEIRSMTRSDVWQANRLLGRIQDGITFFFLVFAQLVITLLSQTGMQNAADLKLYDIVISTCASGVFVVALRFLVATAFSVTANDPRVLSDARKRGLSKIDVDSIPAFVYSRPDKVSTPDCCICLNTFERGEMLVALPCHSKHSFHSTCVRQWLVKQNCCPLCQKLV